MSQLVSYGYGINSQNSYQPCLSAFGFGIGYVHELLKHLKARLMVLPAFPVQLNQHLAVETLTEMMLGFGREMTALSPLEVDRLIEKVIALQINILDAFNED